MQQRMFDEIPKLLPLCLLVMLVIFFLLGRKGMMATALGNNVALRIEFALVKKVDYKSQQNCVDGFYQHHHPHYFHRFGVCQQYGKRLVAGCHKKCYQCTRFQVVLTIQVRSHNGKSALRNKPDAACHQRSKFAVEQLYRFVFSPFVAFQKLYKKIDYKQKGKRNCAVFQRIKYYFPHIFT